MSLRLRALLVGFGLSTAYGCGDDQPSSTDAAQISDAAADAIPVDAGAPDAFDPCPGKSTFQVGVVDWASNENLAGITVSEVGTANSVNSAPNGRVILCIPKSGMVSIRFTHANYRDRVHTTTGEIAAEQFAAGWAPSFRLLSAAQETTLLASVAKTPGDTTSTVMGMVRTRSTGAGALGATLSIAATHGGAYTPGGDVDTLVAGEVSTAMGRVLFLNTEIDPATSTLQATGLSACSHPASMVLEGGGISSVSIVCGPGI